MGFYLAIAAFLLIVTGLVWVLARRGAGRSGGGDNLRDGMSFGGDGARPSADAHRRSMQAQTYPTETGGASGF